MARAKQNKLQKKTTSYKIQTSISSFCKKYIQLWILHQVMCYITTSTAVCLSNAKISINTDGYSIFDVWKIYLKSHLFLNDWISNARLMSFSKRYHAVLSAMNVLCPDRRHNPNNSNGKWKHTLSCTHIGWALDRIFVFFIIIITSWKG